MTTLDLRIGSPLHSQLVKRLRSRLRMAERDQQTQHTRWKDAEERVLAYVPESAADSRRRIRRENGEPTYTTIQIPYTFAQLMAAHTYWTSVFFGRDPVHQFMGRHGEGQMQTQAVEALIAYQVVTGQNLGPYFLQFYDAGKYGAGILGEYWDTRIVQYSEIQELTDPMTGKTEKVQVTRRVPGYSGNRFYNISPYDFLKDPRVTMGNYQKGEFCAVRQRVMWNEIVRREKAGVYTNIDALRTRGQSRMQNDRGQDESPHSSQLERPWDNWEIETGTEDKHPAIVTLYEVYVDLIPEDWKVGGTDFPEKWVFTISASDDILIGAQPLGYIHGEFPVSVIEPEIEAYGTHNRGIPEVMQPVQQTMDWLLNSHMYNVRATLNNQFVIDPTRVVMKDVEKGGPGFVFRLKPAAFGQDVRTMIHQIATQDVTRSHMQDLQQMFGIGERIFGVTDQILGVLTGSGRKTATEVRTSTGFGVNRLKTTTEYMSSTGFSAHAQRIIKTSQQFYDAEMKLRIVGDLASAAGPRFMQVTPEAIEGQFDLVPVDGTLPIDRFAQVTLWRELFQQVLLVPQIAQRYDLAGIFSWVAQLAGLKNIKQFQIVPDEFAAAQAQAGNLIPFPKPTASPAAGGAQLKQPPMGLSPGL